MALNTTDTYKKYSFLLHSISNAKVVLPIPAVGGRMRLCPLWFVGCSTIERKHPKRNIPFPFNLTQSMYTLFSLHLRKEWCMHHIRNPGCG